ncbi:MAG: ferrochelatase [Planctomycetaceae bacterium]|nr:ferrochelatase [Planctomycetaceae bacterium]
MHDAILIVAFGGPEKRDDVLPFLENVTRGRRIPRERLLEVAEHYYHFDGVSPHNAQVRDLIDALRSELDAHDVGLPIYWGNRNWHPMLADTMQEMKEAGVQNALGLVLAAYSSYSSCRQYQENVRDAQQQVGDVAASFDKIRVFYNHPRFIAASADRVRESLAKIDATKRDTAHIAFTAHSIPQSMADGCDYALQLQETCRLITESLDIDSSRWQLVYQSRSGRPQDPWLDPDICDHCRDVKVAGVDDLVIMPVGFLSDHIEVLFDLDDEAHEVCQEIGLNMVRASAVGTHPEFVAALRELIQERLDPQQEKRAIGQYGPSHDACPEGCCPLRA